MSAHTAQTELKLIGKLILEGELHCETGLHVGAGKGSLEIGGVGQSRGQGRLRASLRAGQFAARQDPRRCSSSPPGWRFPPSWSTSRKRKGQEVRIHQSDRPDDEICLLFGRNPGRMERVQGETLEATPGHAGAARRLRRAARPREHHRRRCARTSTTS